MHINQIRGQFTHLAPQIAYRKCIGKCLEKDRIDHVASGVVQEKRFHVMRGQQLRGGVDVLLAPPARVAVFVDPQDAVAGHLFSGAV